MELVEMKIKREKELSECGRLEENKTDKKMKQNYKKREMNVGMKESAEHIRQGE